MTNLNKIKSTMSSPIPKNDIFWEEKKSSQKIFFNTCFDKNHLKTLIAWFLEQYGEKVTVDLVETLKQVGFHQATRAGVSLGVDDLKIPPQKNTLLSQASMKMNAVTNSIQTGNFQVNFGGYLSDFANTDIPEIKLIFLDQNWRL